MSCTYYLVARCQINQATIFSIIVEYREMENQALTYWKNYQVAMQWIKGNVLEASPMTVVEKKEEEEENEELEFTIDDDVLDFYRLSRDHKTNRSNYFATKGMRKFVCYSRESEIERKERSRTIGINSRRTKYVEIPQK